MGVAVISLEGMTTSSGKRHDSFRQAWDRRLPLRGKEA